MAKYTILYAEDDLDDLLLVEQVFHSFSEDFEIEHAANGLEALELLTKAKDKDALPHLIILDINMPMVDGREALIKIKTSDELKHIPIIIFSTSNSEIDKLFADKWKVYFYTKPLAYDELKLMVKEFIKIGGAQQHEKGF